MCRVTAVGRDAPDWPPHSRQSVRKLERRWQRLLVDLKLTDGTAHLQPRATTWPTPQRAPICALQFQATP